MFIIETFDPAANTTPHGAAGDARCLKNGVSDPYI
jgi:hypothetical protein